MRAFPLSRTGDQRNANSIGTIPIARPELGNTPMRGSGEPSLIGHRNAYFSSASGALSTEVHAGERLVQGQEIRGPAIIQRYADTVVVPPGTVLATDRFGGLTLTTAVKQEH